MTERTAYSTGDICSATGEMGQRTDDALQAIASARACVREADAAGTAQEIALMVDQQATTAQDIASGMETVNAMSEQNPSGVRRITEDARQLRGAAQTLHELVAHVAAYPAFASPARTRRAGLAKAGHTPCGGRWQA